MSAQCSLTDYPSLEEALIEILGISRSQVKKRANLKKSELERPIKSRDQFFIPFDLFNYGLISPLYQGPEIEVLATNGPFIALNKPSQTHSHPLHYNEGNNVLSFMRAKNLDPALGSYGLSYDRGLLHRLDYETSGVLIYCRDEQVRSEFFEQREKLMVNKIYYALTKPGLLRAGLLHHQLDLSGDKVKQVKNSSNSSKEVSLEILEVQKGKYADLVKIKLFGGARHQIRAQLAFSGAAIWGDELYGGETASRLFLHSHSYTIIYQGKEIEFKAELPSAFSDFFHFNRIT